MRILTIIFILTFFTTLIFAQTNKSKQTDNSKPFVLGVIDEIQSAQLAEKRILNIYLPEGYDKNDTVKYPVTYLLDGSADEDFIHIVGLFQFNNFSWINSVPKSIVVGIANVDRKRDFTYPTTLEEDKKRFPTAGHSDNFIAFIEKELQPFIEKKYKTNASKTIIGQSLAGLLVTEILLKRPTLFCKYIIISPSLWWDNGSLLNQTSDILQDNFSQKTDIYIGVGKEGLAPGNIPHVMETDANLLAEEVKNTKSKNINVYFDYLPEEDHATIEHQAVFNALRILYAGRTNNNSTLEEARKAIAESNDIYFQAFVKGDSSIFINSYAEDCCIMAPDSPALCGKDAPLEFFRIAYNKIGLRNGKFIMTRVYGDGENFVTEEGLWQSFDANNVLFDDGKYLVLWKKTAKGWKMFRDSFSSNRKDKK